MVWCEPVRDFAGGVRLIVQPARLGQVHAAMAGEGERVHHPAVVPAAPNGLHHRGHPDGGKGRMGRRTGMAAAAAVW